MPGINSRYFVIIQKDYLILCRGGIKTFKEKIT